MNREKTGNERERERERQGETERERAKKYKEGERKEAKLLLAVGWYGGSSIHC